jgi:Protein of unknown function (DUF1566)
MKTLKHRDIVFLAALTISSFVHANAPPGQYKTFTKDSTEIIDAFTGLTWIRSVPKQDFDFKDAEAKCSMYGAGYRLPSVKELLTLIDEVRHREQVGNVETDVVVDPFAFGGSTYVAVGLFWTDTRRAPDNFRYVVDFGTGNAMPMDPMMTSARVRCVKYTP